MSPLHFRVLVTVLMILSIALLRPWLLSTAYASDHNLGLSFIDADEYGRKVCNRHMELAQERYSRNSAKEQQWIEL